MCVEFVGYVGLFCEFEDLVLCVFNELFLFEKVFGLMEFYFFGCVVIIYGGILEV